MRLPERLTWLNLSASQPFLAALRNFPDSTGQLLVAPGQIISIK